MYINDDGIRIHIETELPEAHGERMPMAIVIHGFTGHMEEEHIRAAAGTFLQHGFAVMRAEMYGHGSTDGEFRDHTLFKWMSNAMTVIDYARSLGYVSEIYLCGHSQGGLTVMLAAGLKHKSISGLVPLAPAAMIPEIARRGELLGVHFDPDNIPESLEAWDGRTLGGNYIRVAQMIHVEDAVDRYKGPVLIVQGTGDSPDIMRSAKDASVRYQNCSYVEIEGSDHCFRGHISEMTEAIGNWLDSVRS